LKARGGRRDAPGKVLRIGVHHANAVVWGPVCRTRLLLLLLLLLHLGLLRGGLLLLLVVARLRLGVDVLFLGVDVVDDVFLCWRSRRGWEGRSASVGGTIRRTTTTTCFWRERGGSIESI